MLCEHEGCTCTDAPLEIEGKSYCSLHCARNVGSYQGGRCGCGHAECANGGEADRIEGQR